MPAPRIWQCKHFCGAFLEGPQMINNYFEMEEIENHFVYLSVHHEYIEGDRSFKTHDWMLISIYAYVFKRQHNLSRQRKIREIKSEKIANNLQ